MQVVEMEDDQSGYRFWSDPMGTNDLKEYIIFFERIGYHVSDIDNPAGYSE